LSIEVSLTLHSNALAEPPTAIIMVAATPIPKSFLIGFLQIYVAIALSPGNSPDYEHHFQDRKSQKRSVNGSGFVLRRG
jgi:hypothetical protein